MKEMLKNNICISKNNQYLIKVQEMYQIFYFQRQYRLDQKKFKEWYLHYFGLHAVAIAGVIMYSPYPATAVFAILQLLLFTVATVMQSCLM